MEFQMAAVLWIDQWTSRGQPHIIALCDFSGGFNMKWCNCSLVMGHTLSCLWNRNVPNRSHFSNILANQLPSCAMHFLQGREHGVRILLGLKMVAGIPCCFFGVPPHRWSPAGIPCCFFGQVHTTSWSHFPMMMFRATSPPDCGPAQTEPFGCLPLRPPSACHGAPGHCAGSWWTGCRLLEGKTCAHSAHSTAQGPPSLQSASLQLLAQTVASWSRTRDLCPSLFWNPRKTNPSPFDLVLPVPHHQLNQK